MIVELSSASTQDVTVEIETLDGTATGVQDFTAPTSPITIAAGQTSAAVTIALIQDGLDEEAETFTIRISNPSDGTVAPTAAAATVTIGDSDPAPSLSIADATASESDADVSLTVTLDAPSAKTITVDFATSDGSATAGEDFDAASGSLTFQPGETSQTVTVALRDDAIVEGEEAFAVALTNAQNAQLGNADATATVTLTDDEGALTVSLDPAAVVVGEGDDVATLTVRLSSVTTQPVTVAFATQDGSATAGDDYTAAAPGSSVTIPAGDLTATFAVNLTGDALDEDDETFTVTLASPSAGTLGTATATVTIQDDDDAPSLSIAGATASESDADVSLTVTLGARSAKAVTVAFATADGTATQGSDFTATSGSLTFAPGTTTQTITVGLLGDALVEGQEAFTVALSSAQNATIADDEALVTIGDDDGAVVLSVADVSASEGVEGGQAVATISLSAASSTEVSVLVSTQPGSAGAADFAARSERVTIAPGQTSIAFAVDLVDDALDEDDETFTVALSDPQGATLGDAAIATVTITDDDDAPSLRIADASEVESADSVAVVLTLSAPSAKPVVVTFVTVSGENDGAAIAGTDFVARSGVAAFAPGQTEQVVRVGLIDDGIVEGDEAFQVTLSSPAGATLAGDGAATITITDDEAALTIGVASAEAGESDDALRFSVTLSAPASRSVTVDFEAQSATATVGQDFGATSGTLTFAPGQTTQTIAVDLLADGTDEPDETLRLSLSNPSQGTLSPASALGTIRDDDAPPLVVLAAQPFAESGAIATVGVRLDAPSSETVTVDYQTQDGTARAGQDYVAASGSLTFAPGQTQASFEIARLDDRLIEPDETLTVAFSNPVGATLSAEPVTITLVDDDGPLVIAADTVSVDEDAESLTFTVRLSGPAGVPVTVDFEAQGVTATQGEDFAATSGRLTFAPGDTARTVTVGLIADETDEPDETLRLALTNPSFGSVGDYEPAVLLDNDLPLPVDFRARIFPNPNRCSAQTSVRLDLPTATRVSLVVVNMVGQVVQRVDAGELGAGRRTVSLGGDALPSGQYVARVTTPVGTTDVTFTCLR